MVPTFKMHSIGTVLECTMKRHQKFMIFVWSWNLDCMAKINDRLLHHFFFLESSRTHFLSLPSAIQSGINCMDQKVPFEKLVFSTGISTGISLSVLLIFVCKVQFSDPLFCPQTKPNIFFYQTFFWDQKCFQSKNIFGQNSLLQTIHFFQAQNVFEPNIFLHSKFFSAPK